MTCSWNLVSNKGTFADTFTDEKPHCNFDSYKSVNCCLLRFKKLNFISFDLNLTYTTLTVKFLHLPDLALLINCVKPLDTSGISAGVGGLNSTLAYFQKVVKRGFATK